jgi:hypothetical protein
MVSHALHPDFAPTPTERGRIYRTEMARLQHSVRGLNYIFDYKLIKTIGYCHGPSI